MRIGIKGSQPIIDYRNYFLKKGHELHYFTENYEKTFFDKDIQTKPIFPNILKPFMEQLLSYQMILNCDILTSICVRDLIPSIVLRKMGIRVPIILFLEGAPFKLHLKFCKRDCYTHYRTEDILFRRFRNSIDLIISWSHYWPKLIWKTYKLKKKPISINLGIEYEKFQKLARVNKNYVKDLINKKEEKIVLLVSRFEPSKDLNTFVKAIPIVLNEYKDTRFIIVGRGALKSQLIETIRKSGVEENILVKDWVSQSILAGFYSVADVCVSTGVPGRVVYESMGCGTPVVTESLMKKHSPVLKNHILTYNWGNSTDLSERICTLLGDPSLRAELSDQGKKLIKQHFHAKRTAQRFLGIFNKLIEQYS